jgi:peroxiredoxin
MKTSKSAIRFAAAFALIALTYSASAPNGPRSAVSVGQKAPSFQAKTVDGKTINFPDDYKGKVVLLDFWATWCAPCRAELPKVVAAYNQYHDKGFEVLSVSLDRPKQGPALLQFVKDNGMTWPQIYDGQYWKAAAAVQYGVHAIPCPVLVNGDTGTIIAAGAGALGSRLATALQSALDAKPRK